MKKFISIIILFSLLLCGFTARAEADTLSIVTTIFPLYDWALEIVGDEPNVEVTLLMDSGVDLHSFQPTVQDIMKVTQCDLFIYVGGESDDWVEDALSEASEPVTAIDLMEILGDRVKEEEVVEGMEEEEEEDEDEIEYDEHIWLSLKNAKALVEEIAEAMAEKSPAHAEAFKANAAAYIDALDALDAEYTAAVQEATGDTLLFGDRFPFRYLVDDYGLTYYAAFAGCSAESEASFATIAFLSEKVDDLRLKAILTIDGSDGRIAETIRQNTASKDAAILQMDSMQSATGRDAENGKTYLGAMEANLTILKEALSD